ncbi:MAG: ferredoxin--NADP reductase [Gammaproteobacteria bacterium]|nr:ferredoxin--NADP reductase [Gammaproteobacteria bacterium]
MALITFTIKLVAIQELTPTTRHFQFIRTDEQTLPFIPGQFITLHIPAGDKKLRRSYSLASIPGQDTTLDFAASYVEDGLASEFLFHLSLGAEIEASGPAGRLVLRDDDQVERYLLLATGTGVTPYRAMLPTLEKKIQTQQTQVIIMEGVRTPAHLLYSHDFLRYAQKYPSHCRFGAYYSRHTGEPLQAHEHEGNICKHLPSLQPNPQTDIIYLCGNPNMIDEAYEILKEKGFDASRVRREKYISSGVSVHGPIN